MKLGKIEHNLSLLAEFTAGNERAFDQFFRHFFPILRVFCARIVGDEIAAEDVAQESLVKAWHRRADFECYSKLRSFLYTVAKNDCFKMLEKQKRQKAFEDASDQSGIYDGDILEDMMHAELISRIFAQVDTLPEQCRRVIRMTFQEGKTPREISEELGVTVSTVNNQKMRGLTLLKGKLSDRDYLTAVVILTAGILH
ncbi:RNA polymerase sigma factor [Pedobacter sp. MC2016-24]|uniref:RNA polymerase sigma factor n=1 Tax=Pedobacter sp. MC2016-24 TaxID=2780090 RepID=UPI001880DFD6|nr:sigma-70 family RNA polymerase sigma factor [Pedobacter sp. MC2016-24]MBE9600289.1 sigma-70 family RNA polymerase sigma factor [Pedobacter sp. MC2016-24]